MRSVSLGLQYSFKDESIQESVCQYQWWLQLTLSSLQQVICGAMTSTVGSLWFLPSQTPAWWPLTPESTATSSWAAMVCGTWCHLKRPSPCVRTMTRQWWVSAKASLASVYASLAVITTSHFLPAWFKVCCRPRITEANLAVGFYYETWKII